ncbi:MAG: hypothetical protein HQL39_20600 [Alphaproteobacteria bacterium]|nr:hypothetical protein [Alphaproteobacteria bacterium]
MKANLFDPVAAWDALPADLQRRIGIAALVFSVGAEGVFRNMTEKRSFITAWFKGTHSLSAWARRANLLPPDGLRLPDLEALGLSPCPRCGCAETVRWTEDGLCRPCADERGQT